MKPRRYRCHTCGNETYFTRRRTHVIRDYTASLMKLGHKFDPKYHGEHKTSVLVCECGSTHVRWLHGEEPPSIVKEES